jgi:propionyl-CoA synthetase
LQTVWRDDQRYVKSYWSNFSTEQVYSTFDWGIRDADGYYFILGRTDDVINVAGHRLGTREIEESVSSHENVSEVAVVGVEDKVKGQVAFAFVIPKHSDKVATPEAKKQFEKEVFAVVDRQLGAVARPAHVFCVNLLPKTRSGKLLRRSIQAICEGRDPGDLTTIEDPSSLTQIREALKS